ncbi:lysine biosynthesis protein LysW [Candidatus Wirthbacteria bacterium CG2_30_54_11]|uniref:Lysine biosynthesis protein LysW n=1 Tax=Candidatus Wirthbacteria bacterium CG2_30_54_11 TaxID=1817892 RepID=A0A1J5IU73_9BACT|nr:MAG: lysine biosynthesis protein LysW [Candidatus Wirthbacteria bacterium CG2_30_54_11]
MVYSFLAECPECGAKIELTSDVEESEVVSCSDCGVELEVAEVKPAIVLKIAPAEAEDWGQ